MTLLSFPVEILLMIIANLANLTDLHALLLSSRRLSNICLHLSSDILHLIFQRSYSNPNFLLAATKARQLGDWCSEFPKQKETLGSIMSKPKTPCPAVIRILPLRYEDVKAARAYYSELSTLIHHRILTKRNTQHALVKEKLLSKAILVHEINAKLFQISPFAAIESLSSSLIRPQTYQGSTTLESDCVQFWKACREEPSIKENSIYSEAPKWERYIMIEESISSIAPAVKPTSLKEPLDCRNLQTLEVATYALVILEDWLCLQGMLALTDLLGVSFLQEEGVLCSDILRKELEDWMKHRGPLETGFFTAKSQLESGDLCQR